MAENAALPIIEVRDNFNKVLINNEWCQFANFEYKITRHGEDIKTKGKWIILDCKTIKDEDGGEFTLILDSADLDTDAYFFKAYERQKPKSVKVKLKQKNFKNGNVLRDIEQKDTDYVARDENKVLIATEPCLIHDDAQGTVYMLGQ